MKLLIRVQRFIPYFILLFSLQVHAAIIDFDIPGDGALIYQTADYFEDGFRMRLDLDSGHYDLQYSIDNHYLMVDNQSGEIISKPTSQVTFDHYGAFFDLLSFEFTVVDVDPTDPSNNVTMTSSAGGYLDLADAFSGTWDTLYFSESQWQNLTWLTFTTTTPVWESFGE